MVAAKNKAKTQKEQQPAEQPNRICCCNLKTAGYVVGLVEILLCILAVYGLFRNFHLFGMSYFFWFVVGIISIIIILIAIAVLFYAIKKENPRWLLPHLSAQIFLILFLFIVALVTAILLALGAYQGIRRLIGHGGFYMSDSSTRALGILIIIVYLAVAILEIFFLYIIWKLYKHLKAYKQLEEQKRDFRLGGAAYNANDWYIAPENDKAYGGGPDAGDIYPYDAPFDQQCLISI
ncbi:unnamed protein product [Bursaphelenchus okinawaensis]|uniref:Uncharacterized protein n=1 Tax=Bursaphelenchus okinawaensis TaxID=465554 RepID=A0A811JQ18_9BILA|nr:unnamed protein product [Bursaphelenchus okinawaensis]CAG9076984.1 unnamed protein product [Bursaphelenchus okinawaensis]